MQQLIIGILFFLGLHLYAQESVLKGRILEAHSSDPIERVTIRLDDTDLRTETTIDGLFHFKNTLPQGEKTLVIIKDGYLAQRILIRIDYDRPIDLDPIFLELDRAEIDKKLGIISLTDTDLEMDEAISYNVSGLLSSNKDIFLNAAAFDFSAAFFRPRGLDNSYGKVLINGIEMNMIYNGRPQWSSWGGLNDVQRHREFYMGMKSNEYSFGGVAGTTNIHMRASKLRRGGSISYASSNRSYRGRVMGSYNSGLTKKGWAYSFLISRRYGQEGYKEGTFYEANSYYASVEKVLNDKHSINLTSFYTPNKRARATAVTNEVINLKGITFNPNWGYQDDQKRSSSVRRIDRPLIILNHYWKLNDKTSINTNIGYQFGKSGNSRLDYSGNRNPAGNYYQRLPSYFLREENPTIYDYQLAYLAEQEFINDGQIDWLSLYEGNTINGLSVYSIQEDIVDDKKLTINSIFSSNISQHFILNGAIDYRNLKSENYVLMQDLLGGNGYLDIDYFGDSGYESNSDLLKPNRIVQTGDRLKYNYKLKATLFSGFLQAQFSYNKTDFYIGLSTTLSNYQRNGMYQNGYFSEDGRSLGPSEKIALTSFATKGGITYKITGRHLIDINGGYISKAPNLGNSFVNPRQNNDLVIGLTPEKILTADIGYIFRSPIVKARLTGYYTELQDQTDIGFFFTQNALGNDETTAFVQEVVTGMNQRNMGVEFSAEAQLSPTFKIKAAGSIGQNVYTNSPSLYLASDDFGSAGNDILAQGIRPVSLKNYHVAGGPERAYQLGFEYRAVDYWWFGLTTNYLSNAYVDISNLRRTKDFYTDVDGQPFNDYNAVTAKVLLKQEQLDDFFLVNIIGGKSWRIKNYFFGLFAIINNVLDQSYKTGGFENSRRANYRQQIEEQKRKIPLFGNRYFIGPGISYFLNVYVRF